MKSLKKFLLSIFLTWTCTIYVYSMDIDEDTPLIQDESYTMGVLENGLKYYIYPTDVKEKQVFLQVTVNTGSIYENDVEQGLSHYIEHMAFNSTEKYDRKQFEALERNLGITLGAHSNAATGFRVVYYHVNMLDVKEEKLESLFDIMSQRTLYITFDPYEVEAERGVILSEKDYRTGSVSWDQLQFYVGALLRDTIYPHRYPIGLEDTIENATPEILNTLYNKWYKPSNMAVTVVGDIGIKDAERLIRKYFNKQAPNNELTSIDSIKLPNNTKLYKKGIYLEELKQNTAELLITQRRSPLQTLGDYKREIVSQALTKYYDEQFDEYLVAHSFESSINDLSLYKNDFDNMFSLYSIEATIKQGELDKGLEEAQNFLSGVYSKLGSEATLAQVKKDAKKMLEDISNLPREEFNALAKKARDNFIDGTLMLDEREIAKKYGPQIVEMIQSKDLVDFVDFFYEAKSNQSLLLLVGEVDKSFVDTQGMIAPTLNIELLASKKLNENSFIPKNYATLTIQDLVRSPSPGSIVNEVLDEKNNIYTWQLSNGNKVVFKQVDIKEENKTQLIISAYNEAIEYSYQRRNLFLESVTNKMFENASIDGMPFFKALDIFRSQSSIGANGMTVRTNLKKYFEDSFQKLHLVYTKTRLSEGGLEKTKDLILQDFDEDLYHPISYTIKKLRNYTFKNSKYFKDNLDRNNIIQMSFRNIEEYRKVLFTAKDNIFFIVANEDPQLIKELVAQWIASIPTSQTYPIDIQDDNYSVNKSYTEFANRLDDEDVAYVVYGTIRKEIKKGMGSSDLARRRSVVLHIVSSYLDYITNEVLREEQGNSYFISNSITLKYNPLIKDVLTIFFPSPVENARKSVDEIKSLLAHLVPVDSKILEESKKIARSTSRDYFTNLKQEIYTSLSSIRSSAVDGTPLFLEFDEDYIMSTIDTVSAKEVNSLFKEILSNDNFILVTVPKSSKISKK